MTIPYENWVPPSKERMEYYEKQLKLKKKICKGCKHCMASFFCIYWNEECINGSMYEL